MMMVMAPVPAERAMGVADIVRCVLRQMPAWQRARMRRVCKSWRRAIEQDWDHLVRELDAAVAALPARESVRRHVARSLPGYPADGGAKGVRVKALEGLTDLFGCAAAVTLFRDCVLEVERETEPARLFGGAAARSGVVGIDVTDEDREAIRRLLEEDGAEELTRRRRGAEEGYPEDEEAPTGFGFAHVAPMAYPVAAVAAATAMPRRDDPVAFLPVVLAADGTAAGITDLLLWSMARGGGVRHRGRIHGTCFDVTESGYFRWRDSELPRTVYVPLWNVVLAAMECARRRAPWRASEEPEEPVLRDARRLSPAISIFAGPGAAGHVRGQREMPEWYEGGRLLCTRWLRDYLNPRTARVADAESGYPTVAIRLPAIPSFRFAWLARLAASASLLCRPRPPSVYPELAAWTADVADDDLVCATYLEPVRATRKNLRGGRILG